MNFETVVISGESGASLVELQKWIDDVSMEVHDNERKPSIFPHDGAIMSVERMLKTPVVVLGACTQWKPGEDNKVAVLQLASCGKAIVIQLAKVLQSPKAAQYYEIIRNVLESPTYLKVGVGIMEDARRLLHDWSFDVVGRVEINDVWNWIKPDALNKTNPCQMGIRDLAKRVVGVDIMKPDLVINNGWENHPLSSEHIHYASKRVVTCARIFDGLLRSRHVSLELSSTFAFCCCHLESVRMQLETNAVKHKIRERAKSRRKRIRKVMRKRQESSGSSEVSSTFSYQSREDEVMNDLIDSQIATIQAELSGASASGSSGEVSPFIPPTSPLRLRSTFTPPPTHPSPLRLRSTFTPPPTHPI